MKKKISLSLSVLGLSILFLSTGFFPPVERREKIAGVSEESVRAEQKFPTIPSRDSFFDEKALMSSIKRAEDVETRDDVGAIITPHHFVAADLMAEIIRSASGRDVRMVVIIGPNHNNIGSDSVASTNAEWQTPFGPLSSDGPKVDRLLSDFRLTADQAAFLPEHSIGAIAPFVKYYFPLAKIVPIILSSYAGQKEAEDISQWLVENTGPDSLIIFSIDFSHYLTKELADKKDIITSQLIMDRSIGRIINLDNDNVDCPPALATSLLYADKKDLSTEIVGRGNSFDYSETKSNSTTSYFTVRFLSKK